MRSLSFSVDTSADNIDNPEVVVTVTELDDGSLRFDLNITSAMTGDLRGLFMQFADATLLSGLSVNGIDVTELVAEADSVVDLGNGATVAGVKTGPFDVGIEIGTAGMAKDDLQSTSFVLSHDSQALTLDDLALQDFAVRLTSVGYEGDREGSRKLFATAPYPVDAQDDAIATDEDTDAAGNLLANDIDLDNGDADGNGIADGLTITQVNGNAGQVGSAVTLESGAKITVSADGSYDLDTAGLLDFLSVGEILTDSFEYAVSDGNGGSDTARVGVTIVGVNDGPVALDDAAATDEDHAVTGATVLANDHDIDRLDTIGVVGLEGAPVQFGAVVTLASGALVTMNADGTYTYDPNGNFDYLSVGEETSDRFTYEIADGNGGFDTAEVVIGIVGTNDGPVARDDGAQTDEAHTVTGATVLANDSDIDHLDTLSVTGLDGQPVQFGAAVTLASGALVTMNADGTYLYDPNGKFDYLNDGESATDSFTYQVSDGKGGTASATVNIDIAGLSSQQHFPDHFPEISNGKGGSAAISNLVLYLDAGSDIVKVKIDNFSGSKAVYDADDLNLQGFVETHFQGMDLVAVSIKAGNNKTAGLGSGEGQLFMLDGNTDVDYDPKAGVLPAGISAAELASKADHTFQYNDWLLA